MYSHFWKHFSRSATNWLLASNCRLSVRLSVSPSVTLCNVALSVGVGVENCTVVLLSRHFLFTSSDSFAVWMYRSATTLSEKPNRWNFRIWNSHGTVVTWPIAIPDAPFSAVRLCSYTVLSTIGLLSVSYASGSDLPSADGGLAYFRRAWSDEGNIWPKTDAVRGASRQMRRQSVGGALATVLHELRQWRVKLLWRPVRSASVPHMATKN